MVTFSLKYKIWCCHCWFHCVTSYFSRAVKSRLSVMFNDCLLCTFVKDLTIPIRMVLNWIVESSWWKCKKQQQKWNVHCILLSCLCWKLLLRVFPINRKEMVFVLLAKTNKQQRLTSLCSVYKKLQIYINILYHHLRSNC